MSAVPGNVSRSTGKRVASAGDLTGRRAAELRAEKDRRDAAEARIRERAEQELEAEMRLNASDEGEVIDYTAPGATEYVGHDNQVGGGR